MQPLPRFFDPDYRGGMYYTKGDRIYGTVTQQGSIVKYRFNDGSGPYTEEIDLGTEDKAIEAATKMAETLKAAKCGVPRMDAFRSIVNRMDLKGQSKKMPNPNHR